MADKMFSQNINIYYYNLTSYLINPEMLEILVILSY